MNWNPSIQFSSSQLELLQDLIQTGSQEASRLLQKYMQTEVRLEISGLEFKTPTKVIAESKETQADAVQIRFSSPFSGYARFLVSRDSAIKISACMLDEAEDDIEYEEDGVEAIIEAGNIVVNGIMGEIGNGLKERFIYSPPELLKETGHLLGFKEGIASILVMRTHFVLDTLAASAHTVLFFKEEDDGLKTLNELLLKQISS